MTMAHLVKDSWRSGKRRQNQFFSEADLYRLLESPKITMIEWLQEHKLIAKTYICFGCKNRNMHLMKLVLTRKSSDGFRWQCRKFTRSLRWGTWFEGSHLTLQEIILVTYYWCHNVQQQHARRALQTKSFEAVIDWYHNCRKICMEIALKNDEKYGGPGGIVELCENLYSDRKNKRHGPEKHQQWIICGIDRRLGKCFMVSVENRDLETLEKIIRDHILPGTIICTEYLNIYDDLVSLELTDYTVLHSTDLLDCITNIDQLGVEYSWRSIKRKLLCAGRKSEYLMSYLAEYFYRNSVDRKQDPFIYFLHVIASTYIPRSVLESNVIADSFITSDAVAEINTYNPYEISECTSRIDSCEEQKSIDEVNPMHISVNDFDHKIGDKNCSSYGLPLARETLDQILELAKNSGCNNIEIKQSGTHKVKQENDLEKQQCAQSDQNQNVDECIDNEQINNISQINVPCAIGEISVFSDHNYFDSAMQTEIILTDTEHNSLGVPMSESERDPVTVDSSKLLELADHTYYAPVGYVIDDHDYL